MMIARYIRPKTLREVNELLQSERESVLLGGCTLLRRMPRAASLGIELGGLGLEAITRENGVLHIGAMATLRDVETTCAGLFDGAFVKAAMPIGGVSLRNVITVGGTVAGRLGMSDLLTLLLALDAAVELYGEGRMPLEEYLRRPAHRRIITGVSVHLNVSRAAFHALRNASVGQPLLHAAVARTDKSLRVAVGARPAVAALSLSAAQCIARGGTAKEAGHAAAEELSFADDIRASRAYRRELCGVLVERALEEVGL